MMRCIALVLLLFLPLGAHADAASDLHAREAFLYGSGKLWSRAIAEAKHAGSPVLVKYFTWQYLKDPQSGASFEDISHFMDKNPEWPDQGVLERRGEVALMASNPTDEALAAWFEKYPPRTNAAKLKTLKDKNALSALIRESWVADDYDKATEEKLYEKYRSILREDDHIRRIDRLLWEGNTEPAKRLLKLISYNYQRLFKARIDLMEDRQQAPIDIVNMPHMLQSDPGLLYERIRWRAHRGDREGVRELLLEAPGEVPYPEKWWPMRERQVRTAIDEGDIDLAEKLLEHHGQEQGTIYNKEAKWLSAFIALEFRHQPDKAYTLFANLFDEMITPTGKARTAYWAGRAAEQNGKANLAQRWFGDAARFSTTFYGQLSMWEINKQAHIHIASSEEPTEEEREQFNRQEFVQLVYAMGRAKESDTAGKFIQYVLEHAKTPGETVLATHLGKDIGRIDFSVRAAKKALQNDIVSLESGWPVITVANGARLEKPLLLALMRQESEFCADAVSPSGAIGVMQMLPRTAREIAHKAGVSYSHKRLFEPGYNMTLGGHYLGRIIERFDGSYVLGVASYNAGPARVHEWLESNGKPGSNVRDVVNWIERIPNSETRNYIQHVFENMEVYRYVVARGKSSSVELEIGKDLLK